jgi:hypothetical protein
VPAIKGVTARQAASAPARGRLSRLRGFAGATPGVSHGGNVDLTVRPPVRVTTDVDLRFGIRDVAAEQVRIVNERCGVVGYGRARPGLRHVWGLTQLQASKADDRGLSSPAGLVNGRWRAGYRPA